MCIVSYLVVDKFVQKLHFPGSPSSNPHFHTHKNFPLAKLHDHKLANFAQVLDFVQASKKVLENVKCYFKGPQRVTKLVPCC